MYAHFYAHFYAHAFLITKSHFLHNTSYLSCLLDSLFKVVTFFLDDFYEEPSSTEKTVKSNVPRLLTKRPPDCQLFIIIGSILGCLLVAASLMMCLLSARLLKLTRKYKREKLEGVVREHRMKFSNQPDLFTTSGNTNFGLPPNTQR